MFNSFMTNINSFALNNIFCTAATQETTTIELPKTNEQAINNTVEKANRLLDTLEGYGPALLEFALNLLLAIIILLLGKFIINMLMKLSDKITKKVFVKLSVDEVAMKFIHSIIKCLLYVLLLLVVLQLVGIQTTSIVALLGSAGIAVGLAMQGTLSNIAGGILILIVKPFKVGDYIKENNASGVEGVVDMIEIYYTHLRTIDNQIILIPNGSLIGSRIVNVTRDKKRRIDFNIGISYKADLQFTKKIMKETIEGIDEVLKDEVLEIFVKSLDESCVTMEARVWVDTKDYWNTKFKLNEMMKEAFDKNGIEIPYNQMDVHLECEEITIKKNKQ